MCRGDISVIPYKWIYPNGNTSDAQPQGPTQVDEEAVHRCVRWDGLHDWALERRINLWEYSKLLKSS